MATCTCGGPWLLKQQTWDQFIHALGNQLFVLAPASLISSRVDRIVQVISWKMKNQKWGTDLSDPPKLITVDT